jgi:branched-chain amino acid transport system ATP-binding protein
MSSNTAVPAAGSAEEVHLSLEGVGLTIGGLQIINDVSFDVRQGDLLALIGPNGAGKTSLLNCLSGIYHPTGGMIRFGDHDLNRIKPHHAAGLGLARTFQHAEMFEHMSVLQNLLVGRHILMRRGILSNGAFWGKTLAEEVDHREVVEEVIDFLELERFRQAEATGLPYGVQKIVGLGRALAMEPQVLLLDEPSAGMNRQEKEDLARFILRIKYEIGLNFGTKIAEGEPDHVLNHPEVVQAYIGTKTAG